MAHDGRGSEHEASTGSAIPWSKSGTASTIGGASANGEQLLSPAVARTYATGADHLLDALASLQTAIEENTDLMTTQLRPAARRASIVSPRVQPTAEQQAELLIEKYKERLDAENEIGVTAALIA
ncbi:hypothetical protein FOZ62_019484, partial [Perkinsus olseni]